MQNMKFIGIFAACGFILSFVFGLFSHSSFWIILLRAVFFSALFVALGFLISFIFKKFLLDSNSLGIEPEDESDPQKKSGSEAQKSGQMIDIVVEDEDLPEGDSDNHFVVGNNTQMLKDSDISSNDRENVVPMNKGPVNNSSPTTPASNANSNNTGFVPMKGFENVSKKAEPTQDIASNVITNSSENVISNVNPTERGSVSEDDIDTLPDMENLDLSEYDQTEEAVDNSYADTNDFGSSASSYRKSNVPVPEVKDAALIAKAISTALAEDK